MIALIFYFNNEVTLNLLHYITFQLYWSISF